MKAQEKTNRRKRQHPLASKARSRQPSLGGWHSTDELEIARRRWRAEVERIQMKALSGKDRYYGDYSIRSGEDSASPYRVEIRSLSALDNSCTCPDYRKNGLGTCKHIEAVLRRLRGYGGHPRRVPGIDEHIVVIRGELARRISRRVGLFPDYTCDEVAASEHLVAHDL
jgi:SWIM zinc finger